MSTELSWLKSQPVSACDALVACLEKLDPEHLRSALILMLTNKPPSGYVYDFVQDVSLEAMHRMYPTIPPTTGANDKED